MLNEYFEQVVPYNSGQRSALACAYGLSVRSEKMRIELLGYDDALLSLKDLEKIIPAKRKGKALNYGQAEGQVQIDETVWGIYRSRNKNNYIIQYEEGSLAPTEFIEYMRDMIEHLSSNFTENLKIEGIHEGYPDV